MDLLGVMSYFVQRAAPDRRRAKGDHDESLDFDSLVGNLSRNPSPGGGVLLAALAEVHDDGLLRQRCRDALATWPHLLPRWMARLADVQPQRAVRVMHVLCDSEYVLVGLRIGEQDVTVIVFLDHSRLSEVADASFHPEPVEDVLAAMKQRLDPRDFAVTDVDVADANARILRGLRFSMWLPIAATETWPDTRPLLQWLTRRLPDSGDRYPESFSEAVDRDELFDRFFASPAGRPFDDPYCRRLLSEAADCGHGGLMRWSGSRVEGLLDPRELDGFDVLSPAQFELPRLLTAYIPWAHAQVGVREALTARTLAAIDRFGLAYQEAVLQLREDEEDDYATGA